MAENTINEREILIRPISTADNSSIEQVIRTVLIEYGANKPGLAWQDPELCNLSQAYQAANTEYWVAESNGVIVGGCGIGQLQPNPIPLVCELQKMYLLPESRGKGIGQLLLKTALAFATLHYRWCYLESLKTMVEAERLYRQAGFTELPLPLVLTAHGACDRWYIVDMHNA